MVKIVQVETSKSIEQARSLFADYAAEWPGDDLADEGFADELADLPGAYAPPEGRLLLAFSGLQPVGCIALKKWSDEVCELKRLYVKPQYRGLKIGRQLGETLIGEARKIGYASIRLDTTSAMVQAKRLYESLGFGEIQSYSGKPTEGNMFMELVLINSSLGTNCISKGWV